MYFCERNAMSLFGLPLLGMLSSMCIILVVMVETTVVSCPLRKGFLSKSFLTCTIFALKIDNGFGFDHLFVDVICLTIYVEL
jgi:predicted membrane chloride channel (bestrophin family)